MQPLTHAKMISLHDPTPVKLPKKYVERIVGEAKSAILILKPQSQIVRLIPTQNQTGIKIVFDIVKFSPEFFLEFNRILARHQISALHVTGLCFTSDSCIYEGFFDLKELPVSKTQLIEELTEIQGVGKVEINQVDSI
ncbi:MAG: hypothetical protein ACFFFH_10575 [Candidatus Thorarchaeota archaeon]